MLSKRLPHTHGLQKWHAGLQLSTERLTDHRLRQKVCRVCMLVRWGLLLVGGKLCRFKEYFTCGSKWVQDWVTPCTAQVMWGQLFLRIRGVCSFSRAQDRWRSTLPVVRKGSCAAGCLPGCPLSLGPEESRFLLKTLRSWQKTGI